VVWGEVPPAGVAHVTFGAGRPSGALTARPWRPGDRVGGRKVKDLLMEARLPAWRRLRALLVEDDAGTLGLVAPGSAWSASSGAAAGGAVWLEPEQAGGELPPPAGEKAWCTCKSCAM
jgi:tRNA(Ile)-lysidine synthetase-like protein